MLRISAQARRGEIDLDLDLDVPASGSTALIGPSGAGKSSLLRIAAGLLRPARGRVLCGGDRWLDTREGIELPPERRGCALVFQDYALFPNMRAWQNVAYALTALPRADRRRAADGLLDRFGLLALAERRPGELSGGERQRLALARALALDPRALLLDEPLSALDSLTAAAAARELRATVADLGVPTVLVTHELSEAVAIADRVAVLDQGRIVQSGGLAELAASPRSSFAAHFAGAVVLQGRATESGNRGAKVVLTGIGKIQSAEVVSGPVEISVFPWQIDVHLAGAKEAGEGENRVPVTIESVTPLGSRARVGFAAPQPLWAEVATNDCERRGLAPGGDAVISWSVADTRVVGRRDAPREGEVPKP